MRLVYLTEEQETRILNILHVLIKCYHGLKVKQEHSDNEAVKEMCQFFDAIMDKPLEDAFCDKCLYFKPKKAIMIDGVTHLYEVASAMKMCINGFDGKTIIQENYIGKELALKAISSLHDILGQILF